jgi:membrane-associated protease RseP (regulator of RpoE activity)
MKLRILLLLCCALLGGCALRPTAQSSREPQQPQGPDRYLAVPGREADIIDPLRAAPPPAQAEILAGKSPAADQQQLSPQAYVLIGNSRHDNDDAAARAWIAAQGKAIGADKIRLYTAATGGDAAPLSAAYFVRLRLVFGASFRDLNAQEQQQFGSGVRLGNIVGDSPASRANLRSGDVIVTLDGRSAGDRAAFQALLREKMGRIVNLGIVRNGEAVERKVQLGRSFGNTE